MLYRKAQSKIENWLLVGKDALLVAGARQVGKTYLIRETLKKQNRDFVEFNFIKQPSILEIFKSAINNDAENFLLALRVASKRVLKNDTVIFFDEIQECKDILTVIKFLVEKGQYKYILSGSLLGIELNDLRSAPVGYLETIDMYPMDLEEFFIANGLKYDVLNEIKKNFEEKKEVNALVHDLLIKTVYEYIIVGGMPEAVQTFIDTSDFNRVSVVHKKITLDYKRDFTKYEKSQKLKLIKTYDLIPTELNQKNKRYMFTDLDKELRFDRYENSFNWLNDAGVSLPTYNVTEPKVPLKASEKSNLFKLFLSDVGLLTTQYGNATILKILNQSKDINCGAIFENLVAEELSSHGYELYYFNNKKHGEIDFLIEYKGEATPFEVKSGKDYQTHSALSYFIHNRTFSNGYVFSKYNVYERENIFYLPIYMIMFFNNDFLIDKKIKIDLSKLAFEKSK